MGHNGDRLPWKTIIGGGIVVLVVASLLFTWIFLLESIKPGPGEEAVLIDKPIMFGHGGVRPNPVTTGREYVFWTTDHVMVNVQPMQLGEHFDDLMSLDGVPLDFDAAIRLQVTNSVSLIRDFGEKWYAGNVAAEIRNRIRQAVRKHGMNETAISTAAIESIDLEVSEAMVKYLVDAKLPVRLIQITVGKANPPDAIKTQRIETAAQQQRALTEQQKKLAEDQRKQAELSRADADNAYRNAMQLSPNQFLQLETIKIQLENIKMQEKVCEKGKCTFIISDGKVTPIVDTTK